MGQELVYRFVDQYLPNEYDRVQVFFRRPGAYQRYNDFLDAIGLLQQWYDFESKEEKLGLELWCQDKGIEFERSG